MHIFSKLRLLLGAVATVCLLLNSCSKPSDDEIPGYLRIEAPEVIIKTANDEFVSQQAVRDVWLFQNGALIGTFQPPVTIPVLHRDRGFYIIACGVWNNADPRQRVIYPYWKFDTLQYNFAPEEQYSWKPQVRYFDDTQLNYPFIETFEGSDIQFNYGQGVVDTAYIRRVASPDAYEGNNYGRVGFGLDSTHFYVISSQAFKLPLGRVWAEITYRGNRKFGVGLLAATVSQSALLPAPPGFVPSLPPDVNGWQTVYVELSQVVAQVNTNATFRLYINSVSQSTGQEILEFDQIRVVHFK